MRPNSEKVDQFLDEIKALCLKYELVLFADKDRLMHVKELDPGNEPDLNNILSATDHTGITSRS